MKNIRGVLVVMLMGFLFSGSNAYASFPVENSDTRVVIDGASTDHGKGTMSSSASTKAGDDLIVTLVLWFFLGWIA
ncbi:MAG: hypothetical protein JKX73_01180 [Flavobacteriales bacterium]|nr:hypothetical protein [Flavobacteriales bacterium]